MKIVSIGGGSIETGATAAIDREILRLSGAAHPRLLFIPTASADDPGYCDNARRHFGGRLGCRVETLLVWKKSVPAAEIARKIRDADVLYVGGGNTLKMVNRWKRLGIDRLLRQAGRRGAVLCGLSAGAICWYRWGNSDSRIKYPGDKTLIRVSGLGLVDALMCPHYDGEAHRQASLKAMMRRTPGMAIALEDCAALVVVDGRWRVLTSRRGQKAYRVFWENGAYRREALTEDRKMRKMSELGIEWRNHS